MEELHQTPVYIAGGDADNSTCCRGEAPQGTVGGEAGLVVVVVVVMVVVVVVVVAAAAVVVVMAASSGQHAARVLHYGAAED